jgi:aryl sulfotransferase
VTPAAGDPGGPGPAGDAGPVRYRSPEEDSGRWRGFPFRAGDIVVSTRSKSGTTWVQMVCALLVFGRPELPAPLAELSPWLDWTGEPLADVVARLDAQRHRRFVKTHTPLDGVPLDPRATYVVVARHPLDMAVSLYHQGANLDRARIAELTGTPAAPPAAPRPSLHDWLLRWTQATPSHLDAMDSLPGVLWHVSDAWRRRDAGNVVLVHYQDLVDDLEGEMRRLAGRLGIAVAEDAWPPLVAAAGFEAMRAASDRLVPDPRGVLLDRRAFFRRGRSGAGREVLTPDELSAYEARVAAALPPDLLAWLHRP